MCILLINVSLIHFHLFPGIFWSYEGKNRNSKCPENDGSGYIHVFCSFNQIQWVQILLLKRSNPRYFKLHTISCNLKFSTVPIVTLFRLCHGLSWTWAACGCGDKIWHGMQGELLTCLCNLLPCVSWTLIVTIPSFCFIIWKSFPLSF